MERIDKYISNINQAICDNINMFTPEHRGLLSQNILAQLRNLVEHIALKIYSANRDLDVTYQNLCKGMQYINSHGQYRALSRFHWFLQGISSHYTLDPENSERLMLKYYEYLLKIKILLHDQFDLEILENIHKFPINTDPCLKEYYEKIAEQLQRPSNTRNKSTTDRERFYIQKVHPFFVNQQIYYEITFITATDHDSKFNRLIAFTKCDILPNYAVRLELSNTFINVFDQKMPIQIIENWEINIRPCEFNNFATVFGPHDKIKHTNETLALMGMMKQKMMTFVDIIDLSDNYFNSFKNELIKKSNSTKLQIWNIIEKCRAIYLQKAPAYNILRYLLFHLNNKIIKQQISNNECDILSSLFLKPGVKPFDEMPFTTSLIGHNPKVNDLFECISIEGRESEFLARTIRNNTEIYGKLYTSEDEIQLNDIEKLISIYNDKLYFRHKPKRQNRKVQITFIYQRI